MIYSGYIPIGGWHISSDIAKAFSTNFATAEKLKILYGTVADSNIRSSNIITLDDVDGNQVNITIRDLASVILPRLEEILELLKKEYDKVNIDNLISRRIVLTGGASLLKGLKEKVALIFTKQVRIAKPNILNGFVEDYNPGVFSTSIGIIEVYANRQKKNHITSENYDIQQNWGKKILTWLRENI
jgi:cell division protein FtsA